MKFDLCCLLLVSDSVLFLFYCLLCVWHHHFPMNRSIVLCQEEAIVYWASMHHSGSTAALKVHLTSKFSLHALVIIYSKKFHDFVKSSVFYAPLMYGKSYWNRHHFGSRACFKGQGSGDYCDVTSRTQQSVFRAISYSLLVYVWKATLILVANNRCTLSFYTSTFITILNLGWTWTKRRSGTTGLSALPLSVQFCKVK